MSDSNPGNHVSNEHNGTASPPDSSINGEPHRCRTHKKKYTGQDRAAWTTAIATGVIGVFTVVLACLGCLQWRSLESQLDLAYPPHLTAANFVVYETGRGSPLNVNNANVAPPMAPKTPLSITLLINNDGGRPAIIKNTGCRDFWWAGKRLPMNTPLNVREPDVHKVRILTGPKGDEFGTEEPKTIAPGGFVGCFFDTKVPDDTVGKDFYVLGFVHYLDGPGTFRSLLFARKYDAANGVFTAVKDEPDYDNQKEPGGLH